MAGGSWTDPVDVGVEAVPTNWFTNTSDNARCVHKGNGQSVLTSIAPDGDGVLDIGTTDETFLIDLDTNPLKYITTTGRQAGNRIQLIITDGSSGGPDIYNYASASPPAGTASILVSNGGGLALSSYGVTAHILITLVYSGTYWYCNPYGMLGLT